MLCQGRVIVSWLSQCASVTKCVTVCHIVLQSVSQYVTLCYIVFYSVSYSVTVSQYFHNGTVSWCAILSQCYRVCYKYVTQCVTQCPILPYCHSVTIASVIVCQGRVTVS